MAEQDRRLIRWDETPGIPTGNRSEPLVVTAHIPGQVFLPRQHVALDALLAAKVCLLQHVPPASNGAEVSPVTIPIDEASGVHLCSFSVGKLGDFDRRYQNRRPPVEQYQQFGNRGTVNISLGSEKAYHTLYQSAHVEGAELSWYCVGQSAAIEYLLAFVRHIGKRTSVGYGRVERWDVRQFDGEPWPGFPVMTRHGRALRPLPLDFPGLDNDNRQAYACLTYPYWDQSKEVLCVIPG